MLRLLALGCGTAGLLASTALAAPVACPAVAPPEWRIPRGPLDGVEVLTSRIGEAIDLASPPSDVPGESTIRGGVLRQAWDLSQLEAGWHAQLLCHYRGTARTLLVEVPPGAKRCERQVTSYRSSGPPAPNSIDRISCE